MDNEFNYQNTENKDDIHDMNYEYNTSYNAQPFAPESGPVSLGDWVVTMIIGAIPCIGLIVYIVWAFSNTINPSKRNYCRASLIFAAIGIVLYLLLAVVFGISFLSGMSAGGTL